MGEYFIHPTSAADDQPAKIGDNTKIWHFSHILKNTVIGENCTIGQNVTVGPDVTVGRNCKIQNNVSVYKGVELEDDVFCGPSMVFTNVFTPRAFVERKSEFLKTLVKKGATLGANSTIICGNTIGRYAMVGAGSVITRSIPDYSLYIGVPARHAGWVCKCGTVLTRQIKADPVLEIKCGYCSSQYSLSTEGLVPLNETL